MSHNLIIIGVTLQTTFSLLWVAWGLLFLAIEGTALLWSKKFDDDNPSTRHDGGTLSELVWRWTRQHHFIYLAFFGFWIWLTGHFLFEIW